VEHRRIGAVGNPSAGINLGAEWNLVGTPTAVGTFPFTVYVVDNNGAVSSASDQVTVRCQPHRRHHHRPAPTTAPANQPFLQVTLANPIRQP